MADNSGSVEAEAPKAGAEEQELENKGGEGSGHEPDWKALLRIERERAEKAERDRDNYKQGLLAKKYTERTQRDEPLDEETLDDKIAKGVQSAIAPLTAAFAGNRIDTILTSMVKDGAKRDIVKFYFENRIQRTGTSDDAIKADLETALAIADSKRVTKENEELKRMEQNRVYVPPAAGGGSTDRGGNIVRKTHQWTPEQEAALEQRARSIGVDPEKYKEASYRELQAGTAFAIKPQPKK